MADMHYFDVEIAKLYGVNCAVVLQNIYHWVKKNKANEKNYYDGQYWTYNSKKAFAELFPYMNERQIAYSLKKLIDDGIIMTANYNDNKYDRTLWYAITKKGYCILQNCRMDETKIDNGINEIVEPIPYNKQDNKTSNKNTDIKADKPNSENPYTVIIEYLNEKAGTKFKAKSKATQTLIHARLSEGFTVDDFKIVIDKKCDEWNGTDFAQYLRPATLFGTKFEGYLNAPAIERKTYGKTGVEIRQNADDDLAGIL